MTPCSFTSPSHDGTEERCAENALGTGTLCERHLQQWADELAADTVAAGEIERDALAEPPIGDRDGKGELNAEDAIAGFVSCDEADEIANRYNRSHWRDRTPGERARYSIPANPRRDDDLRLSAFINRTRRLEAEAASALARVAELEEEAACREAKIAERSSEVGSAREALGDAMARVAEVEAERDEAREQLRRWQVRSDRFMVELSRLQPVVEALKKIARCHCMSPTYCLGNVRPSEPCVIHVARNALYRLGVDFQLEDALSSPPQGAGGHTVALPTVTLTDERGRALDAYDQEPLPLRDPNWDEHSASRPDFVVEPPQAFPSAIGRAAESLPTSESDERIVAEAVRRATGEQRVKPIVEPPQGFSARCEAYLAAPVPHGLREVARCELHNGHDGAHRWPAIQEPPQGGGTGEGLVQPAVCAHEYMGIPGGPMFCWKCEAPQPEPRAIDQALDNASKAALDAHGMKTDPLSLVLREVEREARRYPTSFPFGVAGLKAFLNGSEEDRERRAGLAMLAGYCIAWLAAERQR